MMTTEKCIRGVLSINKILSCCLFLMKDSSVGITMPAGGISFVIVNILRFDIVITLLLISIFILAVLFSIFRKLIRRFRKKKKGK